jgi:hypothetical protein
MLDRYVNTLQGMVRDRSEKLLNPADLISYINRARREIAMRTQCVRILTPISGPLMQIRVVEPGSGYANPTVIISPPDFPSGRATNPAGAQATATAIVIGGGIQGVTLQYGGDGYFQPTLAVTDPTGSGVVLEATTNPINTTTQQQEEYRFSDVDLSQFPGVGEIFVVHGVSIIYANYRYSLPIYDFTTYQARIRNYPTQYSYVPVIGSQYGQGANGSFFLYPIASQTFQQEWDCFCLPIDLVDDAQAEAIPMPWQDAVPLGAAVYAYDELQSFNNARYYQEKFDTYVRRYSSYARAGRRISPYGGRW